jgi:glyoxylase-like metal-dependent hydrolase (beta-lactamase superfamily II)
MATRIPLGDATLFGVTDGVEPTAVSDVYIRMPASLEPYRRYLDGEDRIPFNFASFVIQADGQTLLVDTGWGPGVPYLGQPHGGMLLDELNEVGISPGDIDVVAFTHLHVDHVGWNLTRGGDPKPVFPNARYAVPELDWNFFRDGLSHDQTPERGGDTSFVDQLKPLQDMGLIDFFSYDKPLFPGVTAVHTPGHTPGHTSFAVERAGTRAYIYGDVSITPIDAFDETVINNFDEDPAVALETRRVVIAELERDGILVAAAHFPRPGIGRFVRTAEGGGWQAETLE